MVERKFLRDYVEDRFVGIWLLDSLIYIEVSLHSDLQGLEEVC